MKVSQAVDFPLQYHRANSKKNTIKTCEFVRTRFTAQFGKRDLASVSAEDVLAFLQLQHQHWIRDSENTDIPSRIPSQGRL